MSERKINLEEILCEAFHNNGIPKPTHTLAEITQKAVKDAMKDAIKQALELAAENIKSDAMETYCTDIPDCWNIDSITNTINQIE